MSKIATLAGMTELPRGLTRRKITTKMGGSQRAAMSPRPRKELTKDDLKTFRGRFAAHLMALMESAGKTNTDIANATGLGEPAVRRWLRGEGVPELSVLESIADALGVADYRELLPPPKKKR
jgi:transcriptional regulator with XRE-family HTH domain